MSSATRRPSGASIDVACLESTGKVYRPTREDNTTGRSVGTGFNGSESQVASRQHTTSTFGRVPLPSRCITDQ